MRAPAWVKGEQPQLEETANEKLREDAAASRLHVGATGHLPLDREQARFELSEEERVRRASRPKTRRFRELEKLDGEIDRLTEKQADAHRQLQAAEQTLAAAPDGDAKTLAAWLAAGERGERPAATLYERTRERDAARLYVEACSVELDRALEERLRFIQKNRRKMLADVRRDADEARRNLRAALNLLPALRQELLGCREAMLWLAAYPDQHESFGFPTAVALGLQEPVRQTLHTTARIEYEAILRLLDSDAAVLASRFSLDQARQLGEPVDENLTPEHVAMWSSDERVDAWRKRELERAREIASYSLDPHQVAHETRDLRRDLRPEKA